MLKRLSNDKNDINILREVGYILLFVTFFVGVVIGSFQLKNVDTQSFEEYSKTLTDNIESIKTNKTYLNSNASLYDGLKIILVFLVVGVSVIGAPVLTALVGSKGFSLGYTLSTIIKLLGLKNGNRFIFKYMFFKNAILIFIMIFLANYSIKISKIFFEDRANIKENTLKYTAIAGITAIIWILADFAEKIIFRFF